MIKKQLVNSVTEYFLYGNTISFDLNNTTATESFYIRTVKRLITEYKLYESDSKYRADFLMALRDYLITFNVTQVLGKRLSDIETYGIAYDETEGGYFASLQLPEYVCEKFVTEAFIRDDDIVPTKPDDSLLTDPMIYSLTGYTYFKSLDQKLAVYGALNTPDGFTTLVSLPTGGGKSLITQTLSFQKDGLTIVVVPTVSLAIDQERVAKNVIKKYNDEIYYYSSGINAGNIIKAINEKRARILFISPEALIENAGFAEAIKAANKSRYLKNIVIDEAHIVVDWGASFRVDYQCLESWRNMLLMTNPALRTILLSATFEDRCVETLNNFFNIDNKWIEIRCDALRHEPRYCVNRARSFAEKEKNVVELVRKLPHPMIIYVARPTDAEYLKKVLAQNGINNVNTFTGLTSRSQREKLIENWVDDKFEVMIATSAFGVGVDKSDVRTVIHTYIPQNANTYYQELGRGGRDRLPCLSVLCLQPEDSTIGRDRIKKRVLTVEKIIGRWDSLYNNSASIRLSNNRVFIDTSIKPNYAEKDDLDDGPISDADMNWNIYVLLFLRRFNMIKILEVKKEYEHYMILIEIVDDRLRQIDDELVSFIEVIREQEWDYYSDSYDMMANAVKANSKKCISELFYETYSKVYEYCAGCNAHEETIAGDTTKFPLKMKITSPVKSLSEELILPFGTARELIVKVKNEEVPGLIDKLINKGLTGIVLPENYENANDLLAASYAKNILIVKINDIHNLHKVQANYYTAGLMAVLYDNNDKEVGRQFMAIENSLGKQSDTRVIHIISDDYYISEVDKKISEIVDGPCYVGNSLYD